MIQDWADYYIDYDDLKRSLTTEHETEPSQDNPDPKRRQWSETDERRFIGLLEAELDKVFTFQKIKSDEIVNRIKESEKEVEAVVGRLDSPNRRPSQAGRPPPTDEDFIALENYLSDIIADVHDLAKYVQLNYTGFQKIIKKHDVSTSTTLLHENQMIGY